MTPVHATFAPDLATSPPDPATSTRTAAPFALDSSIFAPAPAVPLFLLLFTLFNE